MEEEILSKAVAWKPAAIENGSDAVAARERRDSSRERERREKSWLRTGEINRQSEVAGEVERRRMKERKTGRNGARCCKQNSQGSRERYADLKSR